MKTAVMQPYFFPYMGYFQLISAVDTFIIFDDVQYINKGWINRNRLLNDSDGLLFTVPLKKSSREAFINQRSISEEWTRESQRLLKNIKRIYSSAPYFETVIELIAEIVRYKEDNLARYVTYSLSLISQHLRIETSFINASDYSLDDNMKGGARIIELCKKTNTNHYINPIAGKELYARESFDRSEIKLSFLSPLNIQYKQFEAPFVPDLSIIDVLMFNSLEDVSIFLSSYDLISNIN